MVGGTFQGGSVWMKAAFVLITIGFVVWLDADSISLRSSTSVWEAYTAFLIIGVCSYFLAVLLTFLYLFVDDTAGNSVVLIIGLVFAFLAGFSAIIVLGIAQHIGHSDRMAYSAVCAIVSAIFCILQLRSSPS